MSWWALRDSNPDPRDYESPALTVAPRARCGKPHAAHLLALEKGLRFPEGLKSHGGDEGDRTPDLLTASQALSQLSYAPLQRKNTIRESPQVCKRYFKLFLTDFVHRFLPALSISGQVALNGMMQGEHRSRKREPATNSRWRRAIGKQIQECRRDASSDAGR